MRWWLWKGFPFRRFECWPGQYAATEERWPGEIGRFPESPAEKQARMESHTYRCDDGTIYVYGVYQGRWKPAETKKEEPRPSFTYSYSEKPRPSESKILAQYREDYANLGLSYGASYNQAHEAYRALLKRYHPDVNPGKGSTEMTQKINTSWRNIERYLKSYQAA